MAKPLISTITPCFRMGKYLPLFLDWLPKQTYFDKLEIVLDHNEPTPEEIQLVKDFQKKHPGRIKHIIVEKVDPIGISMNRCIKESSGEFLTIWNVDDLRTPNSIEQQAKLLIANSHIDIVYGDYKVVNKFGKTEGLSTNHAQYSEKELARGMILGPFFMFRKNLLKKAGMFDEQLKSGADFDLAIRLALHGKAEMAKKQLGYYLDEGKGASTRPGSLQPIEKTVVSLRYFIWDKADEQNFDRALDYNIHQIKIGGKWVNASQFIPNYENFAVEQQKHWDPPKIRQENKKRERRLKKISYALYKIGLYQLVKRIWQTSKGD